METPLSTGAAVETENGVSQLDLKNKNKQQDRSALADVTNDSATVAEGLDTSCEKHELDLLSCSPVVTDEDLKSFGVINRIYAEENDSLESGCSFKIHRVEEDYDEKYYNQEYYDQEYYDDEYEAEEDIASLAGGLCSGMNKMNMNGKITSKIKGKHTRFVYDSDDDEIVGRENVFHQNEAVLPSNPSLEGFSTPEGKQLSYYSDEEEE